MMASIPFTFNAIGQSVRNSFLGSPILTNAGRG
jgi:hypothetical protein